MHGMSAPAGRGGFFPDDGVTTDLALEARERTPGEVPGVHADEERRENCTISRVSITDERAERLMGKPRGRYITIEAPGLRKRDLGLQQEVSGALKDELIAMLPKADYEALVVGLGNWNATPDALGPRVVSKILATRHLRSHVPADLRGKLRSVCAIAPGVLGTTGIETGEIIRGVVERVRPDVVIIIDALAARTLSRILTTIQVTDTGIYPGSGVGTRRIEINSRTLGCMTLAIGVPTVVHALTIANDTVEALVERLKGDDRFFEALKQMGDADKTGLINEVLTPTVGDLMVTPKEIDVYIEDMGRLVARGINAALHPRLDVDEVTDLIG